MIEIKFRVWDKSKGKFIKDETDTNLWINPFNFLTFMEWLPQINGELVSEPKESPFVFQQFTGLTDAVGKEIYEGDIIQVFEWDSELTNEMYQAEIIFDDEDAQFVAKELNGTHNLIIGNSSFCDINVQNCKIIGNIYETVHLCTYGPAILDNREIKMVRF